MKNYIAEKIAKFCVRFNISIMVNMKLNWANKSIVPIYDDYAIHHNTFIGDK